MALIEIGGQPGIFRNGTERQCGKLGRYWDQSLTRWIGLLLAPVGGWVKRSTNTVTGVARAILPWRDSSAERRILIGTHLGLFVQDAGGAVTDITPAGFIAGVADETANIGFGAGPFGSGAFGTPRPDTGSGTEALVWDIDTFGQLPVGCAFSDGDLYSWDLDITHDAVAITGAPTSCLGLLSLNAFLFAFGAGGDATMVQWCDQGDYSTWTPGATNQAGAVNLDTQGKYRKAIKVGSDALILTEMDAHVATYAGLPAVWRFERVGNGCGAISKGAVLTNGTLAAWWSGSGFWTYQNGAVEPINCDVWSFLLQDLNKGQKSKISGFHNAKYGEFWWCYPSSGSLNNDSIVVWNYRDNWWGLHSLARTCGHEPGVFVNPVMMDSAGFVYEHETGNLYDAAEPFADTGAFENSDDTEMNCFALIPDDQTAGQVTVSVLTRAFPDAAETVLSATTLTTRGQADQRWCAGQAKLRITGAANDDWRSGQIRLDVKKGARRR